MIEVFVVTIVVLFSFFTNRKNIVLLLVFFLPFNDFVKKVFTLYGSGGNLFSFWKELAIIILFIRSYQYIEKKNLIRFFPLYLCLCLFIVLYFFVGLQNYDVSVCFRTMRNVLILPLLFLALNGLDINDSFIKKFVILLTFSTLLIGLIGIWEIHMDGRIPLRTFMGNIMDGGGYSAPNFVMMGLDRMCSIMTVPNAFGYLMAFHASILLFVFLYKKNLFNKKWIYLLRISFVITIFCLLESFCRTAWFLFVFSYFLVLYYKNRKKFFIRFIAFVLIGLCALYIAYIVSPNIQMIVESTFSGEESSASDRSNNFSDGLTFITNNPFGYGLGSSENSVDNYIYFAESTFVNLSTEIGIMGTIFYILFLLVLLSIIRRTYSDFTPFSLAVLSVNLVCIIPTNVYVSPYSYFVFLFSGLALMRINSFKVCLKEKVITS